MGLKRVVDTSFWTDGKVDEFTPEDKYFMLYLLTNPQTSLLGIYEFGVKRAAYEIGYSMDAVRALIERFERVHGIVFYSRETNEIAIKNYLRHSIIKGGAPVRDCLVKEIKAIKNKDLIGKVFAHVKGSEELNETVKSVIAEYEEKNGTLNYGNDNGNGNGNGYGVSYPDTSHDSYPESSPAPKKPVKHKYGEYKNVLLTDEELEKLKAEYKDVDERIERLSSYIASTGKSYKSHYATIRNWARRDGVKDGHVSGADGENSEYSVGVWL